MSFIGRALGVEARSAPVRPDGSGMAAGPPWSGGSWAPGMVWEPATPATVSDDDALRVSAVFACVRLLTDAVGTLPLNVFTGTGADRVEYERPGYLRFLAPSDDQIAVLTQVVTSLLLYGDAFVSTPRDRYGVPVDLWTIDPRLVTVKRVAGRRRYLVETAGGVSEHDGFDVLHIPGLMLPGSDTGLSPLGYAKETIGVGRSAQTYGANFFANGAMPAAIIEHPEKLNREQTEAFRDTWYAAHGGNNQQRVGVLPAGAKLTKVSVAPEDAQFLDTRRFTVADVARIFGVPPHLIADASNSTSWGSGLAEQNSAFGQFSLRPWVTRIESGFARLLASHGLADVVVKLNMDALLRASLTDRYESYRVGIDSGFLAPDEARAFEDLPPVPGGDEVIRSTQLANRTNAAAQGDA